MKILLADDSALIAGVMTKLFENDSDIMLTGIAKNGAEAVDMASRLRPDLIIMDISMPVMDGITATRKITSVSSIPVLIFSNEINDKTKLDAFDAGAAEVLKKPDIIELSNPEFEAHFKSIIKSLSESFRKQNGEIVYRNPQPASAICFIVIGASTGGPKTVKKILNGMPAALSVPVALVQHIEPGFDQEYAEWLNTSTELSVQLLNLKIIPQPGHVYVAPAGRHIVFEGEYIQPDDGPRVQNQKPSVDVLFSSASKKYGPSLLGVLLTGMGRDGAEGCVNILNRGGITIVQDASTSDIFGMPKAAIELEAATCVLPLPEIGPEILRLCSMEKK